MSAGQRPAAKLLSCSGKAVALVRSFTLSLAGMERIRQAPRQNQDARPRLRDSTHMFAGGASCGAARRISTPNNDVISAI